MQVEKCVPAEASVLKSPACVYHRSRIALRISSVCIKSFLSYNYGVLKFALLVLLIYSKLSVVC